ncbi:MAG TPA: energy transducer TonB [Rhizomicrobium sp.]|nr:energy transducer TonB [Rhizomicrobium sp.]
MRFAAAAAAIVLLCANAALADPVPDCRDATVQPTPANTHSMSYEDYPQLSVALGEQGTVMLAFTIGTDGKPADVTVEKSSGYARLDDAAVAAVTKKWLYTPARKDGALIACRWKADVDWKLHDVVFDASADVFLNRITAAPEDYPPGALAAHEGGTTIIAVMLDPDGSVGGTKLLLSCGHPDLDAAANTLVRKPHRFQAATMDGKPMKTALSIVVDWNARN